MNQLNDLQSAWAYIAFCALFCIAIFGIVFKVKKPIEIEAPLPDESEVIGKDLPVGFRFMKDGKVLEVTEHHNCIGCTYRQYRNIFCSNAKCRIDQRATKTEVIFKYVE